MEKAAWDYACANPSATEQQFHNDLTKFAVQGDKGNKDNIEASYKKDLPIQGDPNNVQLSQALEI